MQTLPVDAADLTPAFMSEALGTEVTAVELLDHSFATNQRARVGLTYATESAGPPSLFVKLAPIDPAHREMIGATGMGEREAQFYADVAPTVNVVVPGCSFAASEGDRFVLLLEDLTVPREQVRLERRMGHPRRRRRQCARGPRRLPRRASRTRPTATASRPVGRAATRA